MEWQRIGRAAFRQRMTLVGAGFGTPLVVYVVLYAGPLAIRPLLPAMRLIPQILLSVGLAGVVLVVVLAIVALFYRGLEATADGTRVRVGRTEVPSADLDQAWLGTEAAGRARNQLILRLGAKRKHVQLWLRAKERVMLTDAERALLIRVLEASSIAPPTSSYDPSGRFARYNFPGSLTKQDAIDLVRSVPMPGDRLPITD